MNRVYSLAEPCSVSLPLIFDSPHSGQVFPDDFKPVCPPKNLMQDDDPFVDDLFSEAPMHGATLLCALFPRYYVDLNRAITDIDPNLLGEPWPFEETYPLTPTFRSDAGIGLIWRRVKPGINIYDGPLRAQDIANRIETYYRPYHAVLQNLIETAYERFRYVWHINCHSMSSAAAVPKTPRDPVSGAVDFCLGTLDGRSCGAEFTHAVRDFLKEKGYSVSINDPFKGVEILQRYGRPTRGCHSLQLEINKALYLNETTRKKRNDYMEFKTNINDLIS